MAQASPREGDPSSQLRGALAEFRSVLVFFRAHGPKVFCFVSLSPLSAFFFQSHSQNTAPHTLGEPVWLG